MSQRPGTSSGDRRERVVGLLGAGEPTPITEVEPAEEVTGIEGTVVAHAGTVTGPMSGEEAVLVEYERARNRDGRSEAAEGRIEAVPFVVEDATGRALVDPTGYAYEDGPLPISPGNTDRFEGDEDGENVRPVEDDPVLPWVHAEASIRPGEEVYVVGPAARVTDTGDEARVRIVPGEDGAFLLSDLSRPTLAEEFRRESRLPQPFWQFVLFGLIVVALIVGVLSILVITFG